MTGLKSRWFVEIFLDGSTVRFWNDFESVTYDGQTFAPLGDRFTPPDKLKRSASLKSESVKLTFDASRQLDDGNDILADLLDSTWRNRQIRIRNVFYTTSPDSGDVISDTYGRIRNLPGSIAVGAEPVIEMEIESGSLAYLERRMQTRTSANQKAAFPTDKGFDLTKSLEGKTLAWRTKHAKSGTAQVEAYETDEPPPRKLAIGEFATEGTFVAHFVAKEQNKNWFRVYALADCRIHELSEFWVNGQKVSNLAGPLVHGNRYTVRLPDDHEEDRCWITFYDGRHDQLADSELDDNLIEWTQWHRLSGVAYVVIEHLWDSDLPEQYDYRFVGKGARFYDRRKDTSAGGSGSHDIANPNTWEYTSNPMVIADHYRQGIKIMPASYTALGNPNVYWFGVGESANVISYSEFKDLADLCDERVDLKGGGTQARYEAHGMLSAADDHKTNLEKLASSMAARAIDQGGRIVFRPVRTQTPVLTLTDGDLESESESNYDPGGRIDDMVNAVEGRFYDENQEYKKVDYPRVSSAAYEAEDGDQIVGTENFELEINAERAQRLATLKLNFSRRVAVLEEVFLSSATKSLKPGDWFTRSSALRGFGAGKDFEVEEIERRENGTTKITAFEVDETVDAWNEASATDLPAPPGVDLTTLEIDIPNFTFTPVSLEGGGVTLPGLQVTVNNFEDLDADEMVIEIARSNGEEEVGPYGRTNFIYLPGGVETIDAAAGLLPGVDYVARGYARIDDRRSEWSEWEEFTATGDYVAGSASEVSPGSTLDLLLSSLNEDADALGELVISLNLRLEETRAHIDDLLRLNGVPLGTVIARIQTAIATLEESIASELTIISASIEGVEAYFAQEIAALSNELEAEVAARSALAVRMGNAESSIVSERLARIAQGESLSSLLTGASARIDDLENGEAASASALSLLSSRVTQTQNLIDALSQSLSSVSATLEDSESDILANSSAVQALQSRVTQGEDSLAALSQMLTVLEAELSGQDANLAGFAEAIAELQALVIEAGGEISITVSDITSLSAQIENLEGDVIAAGNAVDLLTTRVTESENNIEVVSEQVTNLNSAVSGVEADLTETAGTLASLDGRVASYWGLRGVAGSSEFEFAAMAEGGGAPSLITLRADQIRMNGAVIINGSLTTNQLASDAATKRRLFTGSNVSLPSNATFANIMSGTVPSAGGTVELEIDLSVTATGSTVFGLIIEIYVGGVLKRTTAHKLDGPFTHTIQTRARFTCADGAALLIKAKAATGASGTTGVSGISVSYVSGRSVEFRA